VCRYEEQLEELTIRLSTLENQLESSLQREKTASLDVKAAKDLLYSLETKNDGLKLELANAESAKHQVSG
jgi:chromosome segregation ATPase